MIDPYALILVALASYRLARLIALDSLTLPLRSWVIERSDGYGAMSWLAELVTCGFCTSVWCAAGSLGAWQAGSVGRWLVTVAAVMGLAALPFEFRPDR